MTEVSKWNGTGNDFFIIPKKAAINDWVAFTQELCNRTDGAIGSSSYKKGADGVLFLSSETNSTAGDTDSPLISMDLVQPDGSRPDMCGNGVRCSAKWAADRLETNHVVVETGAGRHPVTVDDWNATVQMQQPLFIPKAVPLDRENPIIEENVGRLSITAVTTGVPHAVAFVDDVDNVSLSDIALEIRYNEAFPEGINVNLASQTTNKTYRQRTYERGVEGETDACGTGALAIAAAAVKTGRANLGDCLTVSATGGDVEVMVSADQATLAGPVEREFETSLETIYDNSQLDANITE